VHATLLAGSRATLLGSFDGEETLDTVVRGAGTVHFGVPATYQRLLDRLGARVMGLSALRLAVSGSDSLPVDIALRYSEQVGQDLLERYGTTEAGLNVSNPYLGVRMPGLVGLPLPGVEVALADKSGNPVGEGEAGEILIRGPHVFSGYLGIAESSQPFVQGWFGTGDLGISDPETRYLRIVGRTKEVIITGGMNVYPREVEEVLRRHPRVTDAAVIGVASARWGEEVVAVVSPVDLDPDAVLGFAADRLAPYKRPKRVFPVEVIPRSDVGKLRRAAVDRIIPLAGAEVPPDGIGSPLP
jgi:malonyl-CoA/methylmalonyl-CoA synthetase